MSLKRKTEERDESGLQEYIAATEKELKDLTESLQQAKKQLLALKLKKSKSIDDRLEHWTNSGLNKEKKSLFELRGTVLGTMMKQALLDGCVHKHETKDVSCIVDIIYDYNEAEELSPANAEVVEYIMANNIGEIIFE